MKDKHKEISRILNSFKPRRPCYRTIRRLARAAWGKTSRGNPVTVRRRILRDLNMVQHER